MITARPHPTRRVPLFAFPLAAAAVVASSLSISHLVPQAARPGPIAWSVLADLLVTIPVLWFAMVVRGRGVPARTLFPVVAACFAIASFTLPPAIRPHRMGLEWVIGVAEFGALTLLAIAVWRGLRRARATPAPADGPGEIPERVAALVDRALGTRGVGDVLAYEFSTVIYAFAGGFMKPSTRAAAFTGYRECGWPTGAIGLGLVLAVETFPIHVLLARTSETLAWIATAGSAYGLVWLIGDFQALRLRPTRLDADGLWLRLGLRSNARIPWNAIREIRTLRSGETVGGRRDTLRAVAMGEPTVAIELSEPVVSTGAYGMRRRVTRVELAPDDPRGFVEAVRRGREEYASAPAPAPL